MVSLIERSESVELDDEDDADEQQGDAEMRLEGSLEQQEPIKLDEDQDQDQDEDQDEQLEVGLLARRHQRRRSRNASALGATSAASPELMSELDQEPDEEQLKRILGCKRLSEGNCAALNHQRHHLANICRKNSLHIIGESLPPVTEGEPMRHMSHHMSQNMEAGAGAAPGSNSTSSGSLRSAGRQLVNGNKRNSQDDNANTCSSSTSLDGSSSAASARSPTRRRSSTVSQCSSVLSEGTRQQLNFDLSPDLAPDSSILEANAISPSEFERPASPEPSSLDSMGDYEPHSTGSFDMLRPVSRISDCAQFNLSSISDAEQSETTPMTVSELERSGAESPDFHKQPAPSLGHNLLLDASPMELQQQQQQQQQTGCLQADSLERIISNVSEVKVSSNLAAGMAPPEVAGQPHLTAGQKRAHTPFGANCQRNKATHIEQVGN